MRVLGLLPVVLGREEYAVSASGSGLVRMLLIQLMTEDVAVEDRGGALHLRGLLPDARLAAIDELPPIVATRESAIAVTWPLPGSSCRWRGTCPSGQARHGRMRWKARCAPIWTASWA